MWFTVGYGSRYCLTNHPIVKAISFTGGTQTGRYVSQSGAEQFKKMSLEMGGKNAALVFSDADMERTVKGIARASFLNQGQICLCASRILVQRSIYDTFVEQLVTVVQRLVVGDPQHSTSDLGSLISHEHQQKVMGFVQSAIEDGGRVLCGGAVPEMPEALEGGAWFQPTVIVDVDTSCKISMEEVFGPVVVVHPFDTEEEAIEIANGTQYGLAQRFGRRTWNVHTEWQQRWIRDSYGSIHGCIGICERHLGMKNSGMAEGGHYSLTFIVIPRIYVLRCRNKSFELCRGQK